MPDKLIVPGVAELAAAAMRWHEANAARRRAAGVHRLAVEAARGKNWPHPALDVERDADHTHVATRKAESIARRRLDKLCKARARGVVIEAGARDVTSRGGLEILPPFNAGPSGSLPLAKRGQTRGAEVTP